MINQSKKVSVLGLGLGLVFGGVSALQANAAQQMRSFVIYQAAEGSSPALGMELTDVTREGSVLLVKAGESRDAIRVRFAGATSAREAAEDLQSGRSLDLSGCADRVLVSSSSHSTDVGNFTRIHTYKSFTLALDCDGLMGVLRAKVVSADPAQVELKDLITKPVVKTVVSRQDFRTGGMDLGKI